MNEKVSNEAENPTLNKGAVSGSAIGKPYPIVCVKSYEFEGREFVKGEISYHSWGRNIPDGWRKATQGDIDNYINKR